LCQRLHETGTVETSALVSLVLAASSATADPLRHGRDIRLILAEHCVACHGPDSAARKAKPRLDVRDAAVAREGEARQK
jgi:mono/diheme cytochrome c family protein